ncbi:MAG: hypothetical protein AAFP90_15230, partial [Planctomycetota bacterium]
DSATAHPALPRVRRLRSDQLFASLTGLLDRQMLQRLASSVRRRAGGQGMQMGGASGTQYQDIVKVRFSDTFGYDPCLPQLEIQTTLGQQLAMLNGQQTNQSTTMRFGFVQQLQRSAQNSDQLIDGIYWKLLSRAPNGKERLVARRFIASSKDRYEAASDLAWAVLCGTEFQYRL